MAVRDAASLLVGLLLVFHTWGVRAVNVNMEDRVEVFKGETAQITCLFESPEGIGGLIIQWLYVTRLGYKQVIHTQDSTMKSVERGTQFTDRISVNGTGASQEVMLTISDVQLEDQLEFICLIKSLTEGVGEGRTKLRVFEPPDRPSIEALQTGISVQETNPSKIGACEVKNGFPKPNITWYRNNMPLRSGLGVTISPSTTIESSGLFSVRSELSITVVKEDKDDLFYCEVTYFVPGGTKMTETDQINITVYYPSTAVSVWVESPKGKIKEGDSVELRCRGDGNDPSAFITMKHTETDAGVGGDTLVLHNVTRLNSGLYQCIITETYLFEEVSGNTTLFVNYLDPAVVKPDSTLVVAQRGDLEATCNALSSLHTHTAWFKNGKEVSKGNSLMLKDASFDMAGTYVCVVTVPDMDGMETSGTLLINVQGRPEIMEQEHTDLEESFDATVDLSCRVRGFPVPTVVWTTSDGKDLSAPPEKVFEGGVESVLSVTVKSDMTVFCNATNDYGTDGVTFNIKATKHTTTQATTTTTTTSTTTTISSATVKAVTAIPPEKVKKEGSGVIIAVIIICILLLAILGSVLYFLYKKGKICGRSGKQDLTKEKSNKDNIVVEMKSDNTEEAVLLGVNGEKQPPNDQ